MVDSLASNDFDRSNDNIGNESKLFCTFNFSTSNIKSAMLSLVLSGQFLSGWLSKVFPQKVHKNYHISHAPFSIFPRFLLLYSSYNIDIREYTLCLMYSHILLS